MRGWAVKDESLSRFYVSHVFILLGSKTEEQTDCQLLAVSPVNSSLEIGRASIYVYVLLLLLYYLYTVVIILALSSPYAAHSIPGIRISDPRTRGWQPSDPEVAAVLCRDRMNVESQLSWRD